MSNITREQFKKIIQSNILLTAAVFEPTDHLYHLFCDYVENGANFLIAPTYLYEDEQDKKEAIIKTKEAAGEHAFVCSAITPLSEKTEFSGGKINFDLYYKSIKNEAQFLYENVPGGVLFLFGFDTVAEAKYAVYAVKEVCDLPICVLLDFKDSTHLSDGFDAVSATITLQSTGISALGVMAEDCDATLEILMNMKDFASVPLFAFPQANAHIMPEEYAEYAQNFVNNKCVMFGTGRGTDLRHVAQIAKELWQLEPFMPDFPTVNAICGKSSISFLDFQDKSIGTNTSFIEIDLENMTTCDEVDQMIEKMVQTGLPPVCFVSKDIELLERAIKLYPGRAAIKSDEYGEITAKEYGAQILSQQKGDM